MKKTILLLFIILLTNLSFAQNNNSSAKESTSTSQEEYNYMIKGYQIQISSGLDMKIGYNLKNIDIIKRGNYSFSFNALIRSKEEQIAGILIIGNSSVSGKDYYLGMPINNNGLQTDFENDIRKWDESMTTAFAQSLSELYSKSVLSYSYNKNKDSE